MRDLMSALLLMVQRLEAQDWRYKETEYASYYILELSPSTRLSVVVARHDTRDVMYMGTAAKGELVVFCGNVDAVHDAKRIASRLARGSLDKLLNFIREELRNGEG